jgi:hypothetical protein
MRKHDQVDSPDMVTRLAEKMHDRYRWRLLQGQKQLGCNNLDASRPEKLDSFVGKRRHLFTLAHQWP